MTRLRISGDVLRQIERIHDYIAQEDRFGAANVIRRIHETIDLLLRNPNLGRRTVRNGLRMYAVTPYPCVIFFRYYPGRDELCIRSVRHGARRRPALQEDAADFRAAS
ncbi:MAG: type II toxin-antitoxin system RelE/ParE family toxin [Proteobacteria bacterium]|nr:type II toxin-antitoxin system RelE/ParE family toxin [Pseudomonadota bacterium]